MQQPCLLSFFFKRRNDNINFHVTKIALQFVTHSLIAFAPSKVFIESSRIVLPGLGNSSSRPSYNATSALQLCACANGALFVVPDNARCVADYHICGAAGGKAV